MARRDYSSTRQPFRFPFPTQAPAPTPSRVKSEVSPSDIISRSMQSVKRFFFGDANDANEPHIDGSPPKKPRRQRKLAMGYTTNQPNRRHVSEDNFYVSPHRSRRNGMVFEDITLVAQNMPMRSNTLPNRKTTINLADVDFSKPPPDWFIKAYASANNRQQHFRPADMPSPPPSPIKPPPVKSPVTVVPFISYEDFKELQNAVVNSLSSSPSQTGLLQDMLIEHIFGTLTSVLWSAELGLKGSWGKTKRLTLPDHFIEAVNFVTLSCKSVAKAVSSQTPQPGEVSEMSERFKKVMTLVVQCGNVVDALDLLNLNTHDGRLKCATRLKRATDVLISATINFPIDSESILLSIAQTLPSVIPTVLLPVRFIAYQALVAYLLQMGMNFIESDSIVFKSTLEKVDRLRSTLKPMIKQFDRLSSSEDKAEAAVCREFLKTVKVKLDLLKTFHQAISATPFSRKSFDLFKLACDLAVPAKELPVQGECLFRMALILVNNEGLRIQRVTPNLLLISARPLNPSAVFQAKVNKLLKSIRRQTMTALFAIANSAFKERQLTPFVEAVKVFVELLLMRHPGSDLDPTTVLSRGDFVRGLLKVVRVFHPDKNAMADEDAKWICEEVTKILNKMIEQYRALAPR